MATQLPRFQVNIPVWGNIIPTDAPALKVARASTDMVLLV